MLRLWRLRRDGSLPDPGGSMDQALINLEAFAALDAAHAEILKSETGQQ